MKVVRKLGRCAPALFGAVLVAASLAAGGTPALALAPGGPPASVPTPGASSNLRGVFCTAANNCWAVGSFNSAGAVLNQVLHWNGTSWSQVTAVPSKGGTAAGDFSELRAVRCRAANDCWAVGDYEAGGANLNQALHFNGTKWAAAPTPEPGGTASGDSNRLFDIVCPGASNCWAAGDYGSGSANVNLNQLLRWNGSKWTLAKPLPQPAGTAAAAFQQLNSVRCTSTSSCLAVGTANTATDAGLFENEALRWNGTTWSPTTIPSPGGTADGDFSSLSSLACTSATNCWADGVDGSNLTGTSLNQMMHWDGTAWTQDIFIDQPAGTVPGSFNALKGITCRTPSDCWAVGDFLGNGALLNEAIHFDGSSWSPFPPPNPDGTSARSVNALQMVRCAAKSDCWAVGAVSSVQANQLLHWNGTQWLAG